MITSGGCQRLSWWSDLLLNFVMADEKVSVVSPENNIFLFISKHFLPFITNNV